MTWIFYPILFILAGIFSWERILPRRENIETVLLGSLWGMILSAASPFVLSFIFPFEQTVIYSLFLALLIIVFCLFFSYKDWQKRISQLSISPFKLSRNAVILTVAFLIIVIPYLFLVSRILFMDGNGNYITGIRSAYGDTPFHIMYITSFAEGDNFPPQNPDFSGTLSKYPFMPYLVSSALIKLGATLRQGFLAPVYILSFLIIALLLFVSFRITGNAKAAAASALIFLLSGNLGFWWFFKAHGLDVFSPENILGSGVVDEPTNIPAKGINFMNVLLGSLLPQKGILFGLPIFLAVILLWFSYSNRSIIASSFLVGSLPLLHAHTFITLMLVLPFLLIIAKIKKQSIKPWLWFFIIIFLAAIPAIIFFQQSAGESSKTFFHFTKGWMIAKGDNFVWSWFKNLGFFLPLFILALFTKIVPAKLKLWYLPFLPIFIIGNLIVFSPWEGDNSKLFYFWYLISAFLVSVFLVKLFEYRSFFLKGLALLSFFLIIISGAIEVARIWHFAQNGYQIFSAKDREIGEFLKELNPPSGVVLSSTHYQSPVILSGHLRYRGYDGWLWAHGIDYSERTKEINLIYQGADDVDALMKKASINYILIGPQELREFAVNVPFFEQNYKKIYEKDGYKIFQRE